ncbi:hypothetical protein DP107_10230 [Haloglomus irregulare]|jgi:hypothetical protein|uniref:Uncharacterized protein n=1 Tax=Haloglomus irregulare TaxID=2234134 RepID=A0A554N9C2_9EURY|nr:hypothetical protein [Haloglomus irregulare]TSD14008.1 hypothetical protein DP107_10230 [Haloglomus irregulare]
MVGAQSGFEALVRTFGPFLIPVTVFAVGVVGYSVLYAVSSRLGEDDSDGAVNLSAGTPGASTTDRDHGATGRGVLPDDLELENDGTDAGDGAGDGGADEPDTPRHND